MATVIAFDPLGDQVIFKLADAPSEVPRMDDYAVLDTSPLSDGDARERGEALWQRLEAHPPVKEGLARALAVPLEAPPSSLYFRMKADRADELPWELLYAAPHAFWALDERWPIGRIAVRRGPFKDLVLDRPLSIVAVLSAVGRDGLPQLEALLAAVDTEAARAVGVELHVITGQVEVLARARAAAATTPTVTAELIQPGPTALRDQIAARKPHVLHVLCHGGWEFDVYALAFAKRSDFTAGAATGSVRLTLRGVLDSLAGTDEWLVVLNACDTASTSLGRSPAHELVKAGVPAVIGMRRLVDLHDANVFCAQLYPQVLAAIRAAVDPARPPAAAVIDWAAVLTGPRQELRGPDPAAVDAWADPVLYVQDAPFRVQVNPPNASPMALAEARGRLDVLVEFQRAVARPDPGVAAEVAAEIARLRVLLGEP